MAKANTEAVDTLMTGHVSTVVIVESHGSPEQECEKSCRVWLILVLFPAAPTTIRS